MIYKHALVSGWVGHRHAPHPQRWLFDLALAGGISWVVAWIFVGYFELSNKMYPRFLKQVRKSEAILDRAAETKIREYKRLEEVAPPTNAEWAKSFRVKIEAEVEQSKLARAAFIRVGRARFKRRQLIVRNSQLFLVSLAFLIFAPLYGFLVVPAQVRSSGMTKVSLIEEGPSVGGHIELPRGEAKLTLEQKKTDIEGRVVFRLSHSLILLVGEKDPTVQVIPEERIEKIETPTMRLFW
jgi:hypothetical protein